MAFFEGSHFDEVMNMVLALLITCVLGFAHAPKDWEQIVEAEAGDGETWEILGAWRSPDGEMRVSLWKHEEGLKEYQYFGFNERDLGSGHDPSVFPTRFEELPRPWVGVRVVFGRKLKEGSLSKEFLVIEGKEAQQFVRVRLKKGARFNVMDWNFARVPSDELAAKRKKSRAQVKELNESLKKVLELNRLKNSEPQERE